MHLYYRVYLSTHSRCCMSLNSILHIRKGLRSFATVCPECMSCTLQQQMQLTSTFCFTTCCRTSGFLVLVLAWSLLQLSQSCALVCSLCTLHITVQCAL